MTITTNKTNNSNKNVWLGFNVKVETKILTKARIEYTFDLFWNTIIVPNLSGNNAALAQFKILLENETVRSINYVQSFDINSYNKLLNNFILM